MNEVVPSNDTIVDDISFRAAELNRLEEATPVLTTTGRGTLHKLVVNGPADRGELLARQEALEELSESPELVEALSEGIGGFAQYEKRLLGFESGRQSSSRAYAGASKAAKSLVELTEAVAGDSREAPQTTFLQEQLLSLGEFNDSNLAGLLRGPVYYTPKGLRAKGHRKLLPGLRFRPGFSGRLAALGAATFAGLETGVLPPQTSAIFMFGGLAVAMSLMPNNAGTNLKDEFLNHPTVYSPLQLRMAEEPLYRGALESLGNLDVATALTGLRKTVEANGHPTVIPTIEDDGPYHFAATSLRNPLLALQPDRQVVPNDLEFGGMGSRLTFLTGPNSGGKSTLSKAVVQNQVLAQIGGACIAESASMTMSDRIAYHIPMPPDQDAETGRLGFELARVRGILDASTERSLTLLDDCLDGTTHEERVAILKTVMLAFRNLGGATIFSTHAHELVGDFEAAGEGQFIQVEFDNDHPTHRIIPGVSHTSHANRVAEMYGFSDQAVKDELKARGIASPLWF
ncbi:MAG TPA: hypothetical protein VMT23_02450 [Candidatus Binatia bacterium]|nr:hypothetical protein [Candidatus Binatia bacterium]